jgi:hypothetical protein
MSYSNAKRRRIKPFARPTSFDINVAYDIRHYQQIKYGDVIDPMFPAVATDEAFKVLEGEILMQTNKPNVRRYGDHQMHVFSFANGLKGDARLLNASGGSIIDAEEDDPYLEKYFVMQGLRYAGVAVTEFTPEKDVFEQGFVMTMGGLNTLFNNGSTVIYPGDVICADIPNAADKGARKNRALQTGVPHDKLQFVVTTLAQLSAELGDQELASRFIMGTALSYSRPGSPLDVVLHRCNAIVVRGDEEFEEDEAGFRKGKNRKLSKKKPKVKSAAPAKAKKSLASAEAKKPKVKSAKPAKAAETTK